MRHKVIRAGTHSLAIIIPAPAVHAWGVKAGDTVEVIPDMEKGSMTVLFSGITQLPLLSAKNSL